MDLFFHFKLKSTISTFLNESENIFYMTSLITIITQISKTTIPWVQAVLEI